MKPSRLLVPAILSLLLGGCHRAPAPAAIGEHKPGEVNIVAFGDWGSPGADRQTVADAIAAYVAGGHRADDGLLLGDNFHVPLKDTEDPQIQTLFEKTYDRKILNFPFYAAFGNHDYGYNDTAIELDYPKKHPESRWHMPSRWYRIDLPAESHPLVTVLMLDSDQPYMKPAEWQEQIDWMKAELAKPRGQWTICCAHHTMFSNGAHGDNGVLQKDWGTVFKDQHVDFYLCGHDHTLQHLEIDGWPVSFVVSGGGAAGRKPMLRDNRGPFSVSQIGFAYFHITPSSTTVSIIDGHGQLLHEFTRDAAGAVHTRVNTPSDKATLHPLKIIQGFDDSALHLPVPATQATTGPATRPAP